jgi:hypothetical protein
MGRNSTQNQTKTQKTQNKKQSIQKKKTSIKQINLKNIKQLEHNKNSIRVQ